ncbi:uncharacterized protein LOC119516004 isoform X2 [Choloepus didactylus]|uniref:uncharacterized protein LOC119516004 isoform X2 n=1 Tax=Choloepus didactylus TaxID=27675 RepID=UPI00189F2C8A|nr:uncharacterized protein LOC119516004 isoform X2 [Choloepus didactylus]XP_037668143.1 uncharacterized protein LOC119516004 isoform X2 [Choloepus didactylus]
MLSGTTRTSDGEQHFKQRRAWCHLSVERQVGVECAAAARPSDARGPAAARGHELQAGRGVHRQKTELGWTPGDWMRPLVVVGGTDGDTLGRSGTRAPASLAQARPPQIPALQAGRPLHLSLEESREDTAGPLASTLPFTLNLSCSRGPS